MERFTFLFILLPLISSCDPNWRARVIEEVTEAEIKKAKLLASGESVDLQTLLAEEYIGINDAGMPVAGPGLLPIAASGESKRLTDAEESIAGLEIIPLRPQYAMTRGIRLVKSLHFDTFTKVDSVRFTSVWKKHKGDWKLLSDQYTSVVAPVSKRAKADFQQRDLEKFSGSFILSTENPLEININHNNSTLELVIPVHMENPRQLVPLSEDEFQIADENWEIEFISMDSISFIAWGNEIGGRRL